MKHKMWKTFAIGSVMSAGALAGIHVLYAQQPVEGNTPKPKLVLKQDLETAPGKEFAMSLVEFPPGSAEVPHTHPAELFVFVREGEVMLESEGKPAATYKAGEVFTVGSGKVHRVMNHSATTARTLAAFIAEKG